MRSPARRPVLALVSTALVLVGALLAPVTAGAVVKTIEVGPGTNTEVGLQPREVNESRDPGELAPEFANTGEGAVLHGAQTYVIYWDPTDSYHGDWQNLIDTFMHAMGVDSGSLGNVFAVDEQYSDRSNQPASYHSTFMGAYTDTAKYPVSGCIDPAPLLSIDQLIIKGSHTPVCLTNTQIQEELKAFIALHGLPKGMGTMYYVLTPPGVTVCVDKEAEHCSDYSGSTVEASYLNSFCSYHSDINPDGESNPEAARSGDGNTILYGVVPWTAGGQGDWHLAFEDQTPAFACQDGGFNPTSEPPELKEEAKQKTTKEEEEFNEKTPEEKEKALKAERLEGPHEEEPNQAGRGPDGAYDTGLADLIINQIAVEQQNTVTNPLLNAWQDPARDEVTDECRNFFASGTMGGSLGANTLTEAGTLSNQLIDGHNYYLNSAFDLAALRLPYPGVACMGNVNLDPTFSIPNPVNVHEQVAFDGMESNITLDAASHFAHPGEITTTYATYTWIIRGPNNEVEEVSGFAPGAPACTVPWLTPCAASIFHNFEYGGTYNVTLLVKDVGGNEASKSEAITVNGPPRPASPGASGPSGSSSASSSGSSSASSSGTTGGSGAGGKGSAAPTATAAILSRSLKSVLSSGLLIRYSVNEQVAGHFEVLLAASTARRIGLHGPKATGLAAGTPPQIVIAKAILVTTRGGRKTLRIKFGRATAARLRRLGKVSLTVRLVVRNASASPASTTVLSLVKLRR